MKKQFMDFMNEEDHEDIIDDNKFFTQFGELLDSFDTESVSDDTHTLIDELIDKIIDVMISLGDEDFDDDTSDEFMDVIKALGIEDDVDMDEDVEEGLQVKSRKTNSGRKRSETSRLRGADKIKYLKKLKSKRKDFKKNVSLRNKAKKKGKKYRKSGKGKQVARKYKTLKKK